MSNDDSMDVDGPEVDVDGEVATVAAVARRKPHVYKPEPEGKQRLQLGATFQSHHLSSDSLKRLFAPFLENSQQEEVVDLDDFLGGLRMADDDDPFLPRRIYMRNCMRVIFGYFRHDVLKRNSNRVLLGSPGVGKSVLFFIAALYNVEVKNSLPVVYLRKTREEKQVSAFAIFRTENGLRVFWCRDIEKEKYKGTATCRRVVAALFGLETRQCVVFLDGPRHDEEKDLNAFYEYFCTSGGHPLPKNAQKDMFLWILDGWSQAETVALFKLLGRTEEDAIEAHTICGGCVRDMLEYTGGDDDSRKLIRNTLERLVGRLNEGNISLVMTSTSRNNDDDSGNPDRLRTMFNGDCEIPHMLPAAIQIVDSAFVMTCLRGRLNLESYLRALKFGKEIGSGTIVGVYFEEIIHQWFTDSPPTGITGVCRSKGTRAQGVLELKTEGIYWIPSIPNFKNIDAAVVLGRVLYVFQDTVRRGHGFNEDTFWQEFVAVVRGQVPFDSVHVYIVVMEGVSNLLNVNFKRCWTAEGPTHPRATAARIEISCASSTVSIDTTSVDTVRTSAAAGFTFVRDY